MLDSPIDRTKIEIQLATYVEIALVVTDDEALSYIKGRIAELEQKLREIDQ
jgi:hypothetical protein